MHQPPVPHVASTDPEVARLIDAEAQRQFEKVRLIPSENYVSLAVLEASGTVLTNKYSEGYPGPPLLRGPAGHRRDRDPGHATGPRRCSAWSTPTCSRTRARRPTSPSTWPWPAAGRHRSWAWRCRWAATSPTAGRSRSPASGSGRCSTASGPTRAGSTWTRSGTWPAASGPSSASAAGPRSRARSTSGVRRDRRRGGGGPGGRHRAHRRPDRRRCAPVARRACRSDHHDHAQDSAGSARRDDHVGRRARQGARPGPKPPACRAARTTTPPRRSRWPSTRPRSRS